MFLRRLNAPSCLLALRCARRGDDLEFTMFGYFSRRCAVVLFSACVFLISAKAEAAEERKPNVVLIVADDK